MSRVPKEKSKIWKPPSAYLHIKGFLHVRTNDKEEFHARKGSFTLRGYHTHDSLDKLDIVPTLNGPRWAHVYIID